MKKLISILLAVVLIFSVTACGDVTSKNESANQGDAGDVSQREANEKVEKYPNVKDYPIKKGEINLCKLYIDGKECFCDGYYKDDHPDILFGIALEFVNEIGADGTCCSTEKNGKTYESFCASVNGKLVLGQLNNTDLNIDGEIIEDLPAEKQTVYEDFLDYCCTTLFLEKTVGASVHFSEDKSAAYIELGEKVTEEASKVYDLNLQPEGKLTATNKNDNSVTKLSISSVDSGKSNGTGSGKSNGSGSENGTRSVCPGCGGTGTIGNRVLLYQDTINKTFTYTTVYHPCGRCGGSGYINH